MQHPFAMTYKVQQILRNLITTHWASLERMFLSITGDRDLLIFKDDGPGFLRKSRTLSLSVFSAYDKKHRRAGDRTWPDRGQGSPGRHERRNHPGKSRRRGNTLHGPNSSPPAPLMKGGVIMKESVLDGKRILAVDDEPDVLTVLEEEILGSCPNCTFDKATTYEEAAGKLRSGAYDLVILDIMGVRGFDLLALAVSNHLKAAMLTAHALLPKR
jgi:CheY-like chemotaxis protein